MNELLLWFGANNLVLSLIIALAAWIAQRGLRSPVLAHLLWVLVLVKLVTPPLVALPLLPAPAADQPPVAEAFAPIGEASAPHLTSSTLVAATGDPTAAGMLSFDSSNLTALLVAAWLLGSVIVLAVSLRRIRRFHRVLTLSAHAAPTDVQRLAQDLAQRLQLHKVPTIQLTSAQVSPMVWWIGGEVRVYLPTELPEQVTRTDLRWVLAHELAHVRRRDHFVRWLEWFACVLFWWNPIAWWARRNLRANEEVCCDALVLRTFAPTPHTYANSLLTVVEFLATPALRPPAMASEINSGGFLERRFRMIVGKTPIASTPRWAQVIVLVLTALVMPLGVAVAQDPDVKGVGVRLRRAVQAGELTPTQARKLMRTLRELGDEQGKENPDRERKANIEAERRAQLEAERRTLRVTVEDAKERIQRLQEETEARMEAERANHQAGRIQVELKLRDLQQRQKDLEQARRHIEGDRSRLEAEQQKIESHYRKMKALKLKLEAERNALLELHNQAEAENAEHERRRGASKTALEFLRRNQDPKRDAKKGEAARREAAKAKIEALRRNLTRQKDALIEAEAKIRATEARRKTTSAERAEKQAQERVANLERRTALLSAMKKKLGAAVKAGKLSREDANRKLIEIVHDLDPQTVDMTRARAQEAHNRAVRARDEKDRRSEAREVRTRRATERRERQSRQGERGTRARNSRGRRDNTKTRGRTENQLSEERRERAAATAKKLTAARDSLTTAIKERKLSTEAAKEKLDSYRRELLRVQHSQDLTNFMATQKKLATAVKSGSLSREAAAKKLESYRERFGAQRKKELDLVTRSTRATDVARKLESAVKAGDLSKADAKKKLAELRRKLEDAERKAAAKNRKSAEKGTVLKTSPDKRRRIIR